MFAWSHKKKKSMNVVGETRQVAFFFLRKETVETESIWIVKKNWSSCLKRICSSYDV